MKRIALLLVLGFLFCFSGCKKLVETDLPINKYSAETVYNNPTTAIAALTGIYANMFMHSYADVGSSVSLDASLIGDELACVYDYQFEKWQNEDLYTTGELKWNDAYLKMIYPANSLIEGVGASKSIPDATKNILIAEAKFTRAFTYFYLVNFFGDVPLVLTADITSNSKVSRTPANLVYDQIIKDLLEAQFSLTDQYLGRDLFSSTEERVRPNRSAVTALLARVFLYTHRWSDAVVECNKLLNDSRFKLEDLDKVFLKDSKEAIWQLQPSPSDNPGMNTNVPFARAIIPFPGLMPSFNISTQLFEAFEQNDRRKDKWLMLTDIDENGDRYTIPFKYKVGENFFGDIQPQQEYLIVFRLAEIYLIRAEARAQLGDLIDAKQDIDAIRERAGLGSISANDKTQVLTAIDQERQVELFTEWGDRWFNMKRLKLLDAVMRSVSPTKTNKYLPLTPSWSPFKGLLPIPRDEFRKNPALRGQQNPGYQEGY